jgi:peptidyl-prolyl cis-trans isomerase SDCCAG10
MVDRCSESAHFERKYDVREFDVHSPPKIKSIRIVDNPYDDIVPRITAAEKRAQQRAREEAQREREEELRRRGAKKCVLVHQRPPKTNVFSCARNVKLLSFGADEDAIEGESETFKKKPIFRTDRLSSSPSCALWFLPDAL